MEAYNSAASRPAENLKNYFYQDRCSAGTRDLHLISVWKSKLIIKFFVLLLHWKQNFLVKNVFEVYQSICIKDYFYGQ